MGLEVGVEAEVVPWSDEGLAILWSWPGQESACAECATTALRAGALLAGRAVDGERACARCGARVTAVDAGSEDEDDQLDVTECGDLDFGELDPLDSGELDLAERQESDEWFPEPPVIQRGRVADGERG